MITLFNRVVLLKDVPDKKLSVGDVGTIVHAYHNPEGYEVEFFALDGSTLAIETLSAHDIREATDHEILHARTITS